MNRPQKHATLYRMMTDDHICPFGLKAKDLLEREGFHVEDHLLETRDQTEAFMKEHGVDTTPQVYISGARIGGYQDVRDHFGKEARDGDDVTYRPVVAIFSVAALMALAASWGAFGGVFTLRAFEWFVAFSMCILAIQKLQDLEAFSNQFLAYDLLAQRIVRYWYVYPFGEAIAGIGMIAGGLAAAIVAPVALVIGTIGAVSVIKAVYVDKRELKCACVGGNSKVPLGFISLTENLMMVVMGLWMLARAMT